jgi:hypothetical protein
MKYAIGDGYEKRCWDGGLRLSRFVYLCVTAHQIIQPLSVAPSNHFDPICDSSANPTLRLHVPNALGRPLHENREFSQQISNW